MMKTQLEYQGYLSYLQDINNEKTKKFKIFNILNIQFVVAEYVLYFILFKFLFSWKYESFNQENNLHYYYALFTVISILVFFFTTKKGLNKWISPFGWVEEFFQLLKILFNAFIFTIGLLFILKISIVYSRSIIILFFFEMLTTSFLLRILKRSILYYLSNKQILNRNVLIIGAGKIGMEIYNQLQKRKYLGYQVIGFLDDYKQEENVIGNLSNLKHAITHYKIDEIFITIPSEKAYIHELLKKIKEYQVKVKIIPELYDLITTKDSFQQLNTLPMMEVNDSKLNIWDRFIKRAIDLILTICGLFLAFPIILIIFVLVKLSGPGPAIFKQRRIGQGGVPFFIYKFRTMLPNAEGILKSNNALYNRYLQNNYKLEPDEDPRITTIGKFLRKTSLDELPQLINVIKGDMSLVGPRPVVEIELNEYKDRIYDFLSVKPGITGYWQVNGRSDVGYPDRVDIELYYVYNQSIMLDLKIIFKTIVSVLKKEGAY